MIEEVEELSPNLKVTSIQVWKRKPETFQNTQISIGVGRANRLVTTLLCECRRVDVIARRGDSAWIGCYAGGVVEDCTSAAAFNALYLLREEAAHSDSWRPLQQYQQL